MARKKVAAVEKAKRDRVQALKENNMDEYMKLVKLYMSFCVLLRTVCLCVAPQVKNHKSERLQALLGQTDKFLSGLGQTVLKDREVLVLYSPCSCGSLGFKFFFVLGEANGGGW